MEDIPATQTQRPSIVLSQEARIPWGRLVSCHKDYSSIDLFRPEYSLGRGSTCEILIDISYSTISKVQFVLTKDDNNVVRIKDMSKNGTYINGRPVGRHQSHIIDSNDIIGMSEPRSKTYIFCFNAAHPSDTFLPSELRKKYLNSKALGKGGCGEVRLCFEKATMQPFAIKKIVKLNASSLENLGRLNHPIKINTEIAILTRLQHPFVIDLHEIHESETEVFVVLEYMKGGELNKRIHSMAPFPEAEVKFIFYQILLGVQYLHANGITHRDLKPENILLSSEAPYPFAKIADFGLSKLMDEASMMQTVCGTYYYVAPEVLSKGTKYDERVDVWSLGIILYYMICKDLPFRDGNKEALCLKILTGKLKWDAKGWRSVSSYALDLVKKMLIVNPAKRITVSEILSHSWINDQDMKLNIQQLVTPDYLSDEEEPSPKRTCFEYVTDL